MISLNFEDKVLDTHIINKENSSSSDKIDDKDVEVQVIFLKQFKSNGLNSIKAKINLLKIKVNKII